jgi:hypothetical protein
MAARTSGQQLPWDYGNRITPLVGGFNTLGAIRDVFETAIVEADAMAGRQPPGKRGHVLIVDWLLNGLRDLSEENSWGGGQWSLKDTARKDQTALGLTRGATSAGLSGTVPPSGPWVVTAYGGKQRPRPGRRPGLPSGGDGPGQRHLRVRRPGL